MNSCYLCGNTNGRVIHKGVRDNQNIDVLECDLCGLVFLSSFDHINDSFYEDGNMFEQKIDKRSYLLETQEDDNRRFELLKNLIRNKKILDFGCGIGGFITMASRVATTADGLEQNASLLRHLKENKPSRGGGNYYQSLNEVNKNYDVITLFHVLEHLKDPIFILNQLLDKLDKPAQIIIEVPSSNDALLRLYDSVSFADFTYWSCHLYLYNEATLNALFKKLSKTVKVNYMKQIQRYHLNNHLYWLAKDMPGGHIKWDFLNDQTLNENYYKLLASIGACDTILTSISLE